MGIWNCFRPEGTLHPAAMSLAGENLIFVSGLTGHRPDGTISDDPAEQGRQAFKNLSDLLEREGSGLHEVVWMQPYATTIENGLALGQAVLEAFGDAPPASGALLGNVAFVMPEMKIEIQAYAARGAQRRLVQS